jgi:aminopeptidase-like protein
MIKNEREFLSQVFDDLFPICRSITGPGLEASLDYFNKHMPLSIEKIPSNTKVFDWTVPPEWHFKRAQLWGPNGKLICDTNISNLHVVNYSEPVDKTLQLSELQPHLHSLEHLPEAIPYVTSYYNREWGFCLPYNIQSKLKEGKYRVLIQSHFVEDGGVPFAHCTIDGESNREILLTSYLCHPSLANNELSGPLVLLGLYNRIKSWPRRRFRYRFLLNPETIGSLCFLSRYNNHLQKNLEAGLILTCMGGPETSLRYKASRRENSSLDLFIKSLSQQTDLWNSIKFTPLSGSDERQYCSPGFNLPMGQVSRTTYGFYDGYHNSLDTKEFMDIDQIIKSIDQLEELLKKGEYVGKPTNLSPYGEPQLGKRNLYPNVNSPNNWLKSNDSYLDGRKTLNAMLTILNMSDGHTTLLDMMNNIELSFEEVMIVIDKLESENLIKYNENINL